MHYTKDALCNDILSSHYIWVHDKVVAIAISSSQRIVLSINWYSFLAKAPDFLEVHLSHVNLLIIPTEYNVVKSFLSLIHDRVKLQYALKWLRPVIEETTIIIYCHDHSGRSSCGLITMSVTKWAGGLKVCLLHIRILSFPTCRVALTLVEMLQYCSNVQCLGLR